MKIASLKFRRYDRRFVKPLITSHGNITHRSGWIIQISAEDGTEGYGEAGDILPGFNTKTDDSVDSDKTALTLLSEYLNGIDIPQDIPEVSKITSDYPGYISRSIRFGIETALCDIASQAADKPLSKWLSPDARLDVPVNYLVSRPVDDWDDIKKEISDSGYHAIKIKVGGGNIDEDIVLVKLVRDSFGPEIKIRLDANRGWIYETAEHALIKLRKFDIDYVEEPITEYNPEFLKKLKNKTGAAIAFDESITGIKDIDEVFRTQCCDVLILKPAVIGGITETIRIHDLASANGYRAVITSTLETEIGIAAQLHLAAALGRKHQPCGLDTLRMMEKPNQSLSRVKNGFIKLPEGKGIGFGSEIWDGLK